MCRLPTRQGHGSDGRWCKGSGFTEVRDIREVLTLASAMDCINCKEFRRAMDILAQRILAVQAAQCKKGEAWEKADALELILSSSSTMLPGGIVAWREHSLHTGRNSNLKGSQRRVTTSFSKFLGAGP